MKTFRVELNLEGTRIPYRSMRITTTRKAETIEDAIVEAAREMEDKGQSCSLISAWEVKEDEKV